MLSLSLLKRVVMIYTDAFFSNIEKPIYMYKINIIGIWF